MTQAKEPRDKGDLRKLPMMPIRDMVIFPYMMTPFVVGRESSVRALEEALTGDRKIFLATQHDARVDEPSAEDIYPVGTIGIAHIVKREVGTFQNQRSSRTNPLLSESGTMKSKSQRDDALPSLNAAITALDKARSDATGTKPARDALDAASALLTAIRVRFFPIHVCRLLADMRRTRG